MVYKQDALLKKVTGLEGDIRIDQGDEYTGRKGSIRRMGDGSMAGWDPAGYTSL